MPRPHRGCRGSPMRCRGPLTRTATMRSAPVQPVDRRNGLRPAPSASSAFDDGVFEVDEDRIRRPLRRFLSRKRGDVAGTARIDRNVLGFMSTSCSDCWVDQPRASAPLVVHVEAYRTQQHQALDHLLVIDPDAEDRHAVVHHPHDQRADYCSRHPADAAVGRGAADEAGGDDVEFEAEPRPSALRC